MLVLKVYSNIWSANPMSTTYIKSEVNITESLDGYPQATFDMDSYSIVAGNKIEICLPAQPEDVVLFRGYVDDIKKRLTIYNQRVKNNQKLQKATIYCNGEKGMLLRRKWVETDEDFDGSTLTDVLNAMLSFWNAEGDDWSWVTSFNTPNDYVLKQGDNYYDFINEQANLFGGYWKVENGLITISPMIGQDKTTGSDKVDIIFNGSQESNVAEIEFSEPYTRSNYVLGKNDDEGYYLASDTTDGIVHGVDIVPFRDTNLIAKTEAELARRNIRQRSFLVTTEVNKALNANVGDRLNLIIENIPGEPNVKGQVLVTEKTMTYKFGKLYTTLNVAENVLIDNSLAGVISRIKKELDLEIINN